MNPEQHPQPNVSMKTMYSYQTHQNVPWLITEYSPKKQYLDPAKQVLDRKYSTQKKGQKPNVKATRRGFFLDYDLKIAQTIPASNKYTTHDSWDGTKDRKKSQQKKLDLKSTKNTYIEQIELEQKHRKKPGICTYNICKTEAQVKDDLKKLTLKKVPQGPKRYFYEDLEFLASAVPGVGAHNPHEIRTKKVVDRTEPKFWITKHKKEQDVDRKRRASEPAAGTYKPLPVLYTTFTKISETPKAGLTKKTGFGTDQKFAYLRQAKVKSKIRQVRPSPATYNTFIDWPLKTQKAAQVNKHKFNCYNRISRGFSQSVYH